MQGIAGGTRLGGIVIDCNSDDFERDVAFWAEALGLEARQEGEDPRYIDLIGDSGGIDVLVQKVEHHPRVHLDIAARDRAAGTGGRQCVRRTRSGCHRETSRERRPRVG